MLRAGTYFDFLLGISKAFSKDSRDSLLSGDERHDGGLSRLVELVDGFCRRINEIAAAKLMRRCQACGLGKSHVSEPRQSVASSRALTLLPQHQKKPRIMHASRVLLLPSSLRLIGVAPTPWPFSHPPLPRNNEAVTELGARGRLNRVHFSRAAGGISILILLPRPGVYQGKKNRRLCES